MAKPAIQRSAAQTHAETPHEPETGEVQQGEISTISERALATVGASPRFVMKRQITRPLLKHKDDETVYVRFLSEPYIGKEIKSQNSMGIALMANVHNLATGGTGEFTYILNAVLFRYVDKDDKLVRFEEGDDIAAMVRDKKIFPRGELFDAFPDGLKNKMVALKKFPKEPNKRYHNFEAVEVDIAPAE